MPTLDELLRAKSKRLESVPGKFTSQIEVVQRQLLSDILIILAEFDISEGEFVISTRNVNLAAELDVKLREALNRSEYEEAITEFAKEFNVQIGFNDAYFTKAFKGFETSEIGKLVVREAQKNAVQLLINTSPDADFILPIKQQIEQAVINGARFKETLDVIQQITTGNPEQDGKILAYSKQISHDTFAVGDASYASAVAEEMGATWYKYSGGEIKTTRPFCAERHNRYFCKKEIQLWGDGEKTKNDPKLEWPQGGTWAGEFIGTDNSTIFSYRGGYNCLHSIMAISIFAVPLDDVKRAIENGYYEPTKFEIQELGL